mmetsp:Transcript_51436/g.107454  ORF Transcript_51436/g.107454 Transcript_51436/m.107454 type:complete len:89 (+) Transcript_51436:1-267(+)
MVAPRGTRLRPCCHALLCAPCAAELVQRGGGCPACRAAVDWYEEGAFDATYAPAVAGLPADSKAGLQTFEIGTAYKPAWAFDAPFAPA